MNETDSQVFIINRISSMIDEVLGEEEITIDDLKSVTKKSLNYIIDYAQLITRTDSDQDLERFYYPDIIYWTILDLKAKYVIKLNLNKLDYDKQMEWDKVSSLCTSIVEMIANHFNIDHKEFSNKLGFESFSEKFVKHVIAKLLK